MIRFDSDNTFQTVNEQIIHNYEGEVNYIKFNKDDSSNYFVTPEHPISV